MGINLVYSLPTEVIRNIYQYDSTYKHVFGNCIHELDKHIRTYPLNVTRFFSTEKQSNFAYRRYILTSEIPLLNRDILKSSLNKNK